MTGEADQGADYDHIIVFPDDGSQLTWALESDRYGANASSTVPLLCAPEQIT